MDVENHSKNPLCSSSNSSSSNNNGINKKRKKEFRDKEVVSKKKQKISPSILDNEISELPHDGILTAHKKREVVINEMKRIPTFKIGGVDFASDTNAVLRRRVQDFKDQVIIPPPQTPPASMIRTQRLSDRHIIRTKKPTTSLTPESPTPEPKDANTALGKAKIPFTTKESTQNLTMCETRTTLRVESQEKSASSGLYGDMVLLLTGIVLLPHLALELYRMESDDPKRTTAIFVYLTHLPCPLFCVLAVSSKNVWFSRLAMAVGICMSIMMNLTEWPHTGECTITALFQSGIVMTVIGNISLSFREKMVRMAIFFVLGSCVSIHSPYSVYLEDTFPILGGTIGVTIFLLYLYHFAVGQTIAIIQFARLILVALFIQHAVTSVTSSEFTGYESITSLAKGAFVVCLCIVAAGTFQDEILQKERLEILVRKRTQKLHIVNMALQASETAIAITDKYDTIVWVNAAFGLLGKERENQLLGRILKDVIYQLDDARKENKYLLMDSYDHPSKRNKGELQIGESIFHLESTPFQTENYEDIDSEDDGTTIRFLMVFKDITADRSREVAEIKAHQEATLAKAMGESMVTLTHELRTPLQGIMGVTSLLMQHASEFSSEAMQSLNLIMASSILLLNLINNHLDVKKVDSKMMEEFPLTSISASGPINDAVSFCLPLASISNVKLVTELRDAGNAIVKSNALRLQQVLINLVSNAIKYTKRGRDIRIHICVKKLRDTRKMIYSALASSDNDTNGGGYCDDESSVLVFSVSDCGPGIAHDQTGRLFRRYAQLNTSPTRCIGGNQVGQPSGTGPGLHLCQLFVERMNGRIWVTNNSENISGSTFSFYLPLVDFVESPTMSIGCGLSDRLSDSSANKVESGKKEEGPIFERRLLMVDDTLINRKVFDRMLKTLGILDAVLVESGEEALEELSKNHYDLVITDLQMPGMSGTELSAAIRDRHTGFRALPVVVGFTADSSPDVEERCSESGMVDVIYKPITLSEMREYFKTTVPSLQPGVWHRENSCFNKVNQKATLAQ